MTIRSPFRPRLIASALLIAGTVIASAAHAACSPLVPASDLIKAGTLVMSTNPTLPPLQYTDSDGQVVGMRIELGKAIAKRLCLTPEYVSVDFDSMVPGLAAGRWDVINTGIFVTPAREKIMNMIPYENQSISVSTPKGNPLNIKKIDDLAGKTVGVEQGGFEQDQANAMIKDMTARGVTPFTLRSFDTFGVAYQALAARQLDAVISIDAVAGQYQKKGTFAHPISGVNPTPVALATKNAPLADAIVKVLNEMKADGSYQKIFAAYGVPVFPGKISIAKPQ